MELKNLIHVSIDSIELLFPPAKLCDPFKTKSTVKWAVSQNKQDILMQIKISS